MSVSVSKMSVLAMSCLTQLIEYFFFTYEGKFCFSHLTYCDGHMIFQFFCSLFVVTRYDVDERSEFGPIRNHYHVHLVEHLVGCSTYSCADESQLARNSCPRLPHSVDSRFGLYHVSHVAVVLSFLRSPISFAEIRVMNIFSLIVFVVDVLC